jgi:ABC-2 type transport system ATP-binding protein
MRGTAPAVILASMIEAQGLTKSLGGRRVVQDVSLRCEPGTVTGFLGPNGAGKTTTMRMLCGLSRPDAGTATVLGLPYATLPNPAREVGILLDAGAQHPGRRGREALAVSAQTMGVPPTRVDELLGRVGLDRAAARKRVRAYSLGMRQRLGIAHALLGDPRVLILDEPANGLDPEGIRWMRELLRDFADRGGTVLLSSHLLREVEVVADRLVIIAAGRIVAAGTRAELLSGVGSTLVQATDPVSLRAAGLTARTNGVPGAYLVDAEAEAVGRAALDGGVVLTRLGPSEDAGLEELFFDLDHRERRMSTTTFARPGLDRLTAVELRKMTDTRAGLWLQIVVGLLTAIAVVVVVIVGNDADRTFHQLLNVAIQPATLLLPVIGILLVTSEWTQRTALITFALVPRRGRVVTAKVLAAILLGVVVFAACIAFTLLATLVAGSDAPGRWDIGLSLIGGNAIYLLTAMVTGIAFGAVARSSAPAIVAYFGLPVAFAALGKIHALHATFGWLDMSRSLAPLSDGDTLSATEWARAGTSLMLWMVLPLGIGVARLIRGEVRS